MGRRWIGVEWLEATVRDFALPRLGKVVEGNDPGGVTDLTGWRGGGGFRVIDVAPSMFEESDGVVYLSDWAVNGALAEATAAQLGFAYLPEHPFVGRKGRSRLAVVDGHVSGAVADLLAGALGSRETLVICATSVDPAVREHASTRRLPAPLSARSRRQYWPSTGSTTASGVGWNWPGRRTPKRCPRDSAGRAASLTRWLSTWSPPILDLRVPNKRAVKTIALRVGEHEASGSDGVFEGVIDAAVGMGKTYIMAAAMDYFAASEGIRNFAIITPGSTILQKTKGNFTRNHPKSLLPGLAADPVVITSENFNTPAMRAVMDDPAAVKLYVFTVQSLLKPTTKVGRRTHKFQEGLGRGFYEQLRGLGDLVVFADEHHVYDAPKFSEAVRDLSPRALIGLTGTPTRKMKPRIIYRFPLAAAIAEQYVKTPVIVGRRDDRDDSKHEAARWRSVARPEATGRR